MKIVQIVSAAPGWRLFHKEKKGDRWHSDVAVWALLEDEDGGRWVEPVEAPIFGGGFNVSHPAAGGTFDDDWWCEYETPTTENRS